MTALKSARVPNARFWEYINDSLVKITLRPEQALHHSVGGETDEGWYRESVLWVYGDDGIVRREIMNDGVDCDGRLSRFCVAACPLSKLAGHPAYGFPGYMVPLWAPVESSQRDYSAEAMNY